VAEAARRLGAHRGTPVCYTNSAAVTGDEREVVAYAGMVFEE
jgi:AmmeMemoRadiSam system protein B